MSFQDDLRDLGLNILTGGLFGVIKAAGEAATGDRPGVVVAAPPPSVTVPPPPSGVPIGPPPPCGPNVPPRVAPPPPSVAGSGCCYVVDGNHLLNGRTGEVWLIDDKSRTLLPFRRRQSPVESAASAAGLSVAREALLQQKESQLSQFHHSVVGEVSKRLDTLVKAVTTEIDDLNRDTQIK